MAKPDYSEGLKMAASALLDAIKADDPDAVASALKDAAEYYGHMSADEEGDDGMMPDKPKGPSIALILAKRGKRPEAD
jgi:hypothetical protein